MVVTPIPAVPAEVTQRVGLAAVAAVRRFLAADVAPSAGLKWPNDVLLDGRKLAGILAQRVPGRDAVVVGMGLNVGWAPEGAAALELLAGEATVDATGDATISPAVVLRALLEELDALSGDIATLYRDALVTIGQLVRVELPGEASALHGRAVAIDDSGRLVVVDADGMSHDLDVGDVVHVRPTDGQSSV